MPPQHRFSKPEIVSAGFDLVQRKGWRAFTARSLADTLGASARPIYSHFSSLTQLEDEIVKRAVDLLHEYMTRATTGDAWIDHGIGYAMFAHEERHLFMGLNDGRHIQAFKTHGDAIWERVTRSLAGYPLFQGLSRAQVEQIQVTRWLYAHGLAFQLCNPPPDVWDRAKIIETMRMGSMAIYDGLIKQFGLAGR